MKTTKEDAIRAAYGEYYETYKPNEDGWASWSMYKGLPDGFKWDEIDVKSTEFRPKSLRGIENNNGWHVINGPEDLPSKELRYEVYFGQSGYSLSLELVEDRDQVMKSIHGATHWLELTPKPLYGFETDTNS